MAGPTVGPNRATDFHEPLRMILKVKLPSWAAALSLAASYAAAADPVTGWLAWRGPEQTGVSRETGLPDKLGPDNLLWTSDFPGQDTPVIANGKLYINGYLGEGADLQEGLSCFDADTGKDLAVEVREYFTPDFSNWKAHDSFEAAFARLQKDLKEESTPKT